MKTWVQFSGLYPIICIIWLYRYLLNMALVPIHYCIVLVRGWKCSHQCGWTHDWQSTILLKRYMYLLHLIQFLMSRKCTDDRGNMRICRYSLGMLRKLKQAFLVENSVHLQKDYFHPPVLTVMQELVLFTIWLSPGSYFQKPYTDECQQVFPAANTLLNLTDSFFFNLHIWKPWTICISHLQWCKSVVYLLAINHQLLLCFSIYISLIIIHIRNFIIL